MARLDGTSAIVTATGQAIRATDAKALVTSGAKVAVCHLDPPDAALAAIRAAGGSAMH